jgi:nitrate/TMAO reductase-like tetraheme cytochrome c subunit
LNNLIQQLKTLKLKDVWIQFLADLKQAITAPTADLRVTLMVVSILAIVVSILVLFGMIIYFYTTRGKRVLIVTKVQVRESDLLINRLLLLLFVLVLLFTVNYYTESRESCLNCHKKQYEYEALKQTPHKGIACIACHKQPGATGYLRHKVDFARMLFVFYVTRKENINPAVGVKGSVADGACLRCHMEVLRKKVKKDNLAMSHKEVTGQEFACTDCHSTVAHPGLTKPEKTYSMFGCQTCHDGKQASNECRLCHPKYSMGEQVARDLQLPKVELSRKFNCYGACHDEKKECLPCHGVTMPHPENWVGAHPEHVKYAAFTKKKVCWRCHYGANRYFSPGKDFCGRCHGIEFHGKDEEVYWSHQQFTPGNCEMLCHGVGFCSEYCHETRFPRSPLPEKVKNSYFGYPPGVDF